MSRVARPRPTAHRLPLSRRFASDNGFDAEQAPDLATLVTQSGEAAAAAACARNSGMLLPRSGSGNLAPFSGIPLPVTAHGEAFRSPSIALPARHGFREVMAPFRQLQMQQQQHPGLIPRLGSAAAQHAPVIEADSQEAEWRTHDWLGDIMRGTHMDPPSFGGSAAFPYGQDLSFGQQAPSYDFSGKFSGGGGDYGLASGSFDMCSLLGEPVAPIGESFEVPDISEQPLTCMWDGAWDQGPHPEGSYADSGVGAPAPPAPAALRPAGDAQRVPSLVVSTAAADDAAAVRPGISGGRGERRAARAARAAARLAASDGDDSFSPDSHCVPASAGGSYASHGSDYVPDTDSGSALSEDTAIGRRPAPPRCGALAMMLTIGPPLAPRAGGRHRTDAELKATIAGLQDRAACLPSFSQSVFRPPTPPTPTSHPPSRSPPYIYF